MRILADTNVIVSALVFGGVLGGFWSWLTVRSVSSFIPRPFKSRSGGSCWRNLAGAKPKWTKCCLDCGEWVNW